MEHCLQHENVISDLATIKANTSNTEKSLNEIKDRICKHIEEGERAGGVRDRVTLLETSQVSLRNEISTIKKGYWKACIVSAFVGGVLARATPDLLAGILFYVGKVFAK